jgi:hypothetical protein
MAAGLSGDAEMSGFGDRGGASASSPRDGGAARDAARRARDRDREASDLPYATALVRDPPFGGWLRHPDVTGTVGPYGREHDDDLHARAEPRGSRRSEPDRRVGRSAGPASGGSSADAPGQNTYADALPAPPSPCKATSPRRQLVQPLACRALCLSISRRTPRYTAWRTLCNVEMWA